MHCGAITIMGGSGWDGRDGWETVLRIKMLKVKLFLQLTFTEYVKHLPRHFISIISLTSYNNITGQALRLLHFTGKETEVL